MILGSSPNAPELELCALTLCKEPFLTITTNRGLKLWPAPDYYVIFCRIAEGYYRDLYKPAQANGTKIVCGNYKLPTPKPPRPQHNRMSDHPIVNIVGHEPPALTARQRARNMAQVHPCDVTFNVGPWYQNAQPWTPGTPFMGRASGLMTLQFVCEQQPTEVWLAGYEGYTSDARHRVTEYFDGVSKGGPVAAKWTRDFYGPQLREIMIGCPGVRFVMVGKPTYEIEAPNLEILL